VQSVADEHKLQLEPQAVQEAPLRKYPAMQVVHVSAFVQTAQSAPQAEQELVAVLRKNPATHVVQTVAEEQAAQLDKVHAVQ
jgi:hypothetical protein